MASILRSMKSIELFFADLCCSFTGLESNKVLLQYSRKGQPSAGIKDNVAYVTVQPEVDETYIYKRRFKRYDQTTNKYTYAQQSQRTLKLLIIFYGPDSVELCTEFNEKLYFESTKLLLHSKNLALIPDKTIGPTRLNENRNGQWFLRSDLDVKFYNLVQVEEQVETFESIDVETTIDL